MLLHNLWDNIIVDNAMKNRLLSYCSSSIQFSDAKINPDIISWNRLELVFTSFHLRTRCDHCVAY